MRATEDDRGQRGFTLVEVLVVILIIGILTTIALPYFLQSRKRALDTDAKSDARNMVSMIEACYANYETYVGCTAELTSLETGLSVGAADGQVRIDFEDPTSYVIVATSESQTGGANHTYTITHVDGFEKDFDCQVRSKGACPADGNW